MHSTVASMLVVVEALPVHTVYLAVAVLVWVVVLCDWDAALGAKVCG